MIRKTIEFDSIVCTDGFLTHDALDVTEFRHQQINHSEKFVEQEITPIELRAFGPKQSVI